MIEENVTKLLKELESGNSLGERVTLVAATKTRTAAEIAQAINAGVTDVGENKVQEFRDKYDLFQGGNRHFIGRLQTNKVKYLIGKTYLYHSADRDELIEEIATRSVRAGIVSDILIQINAGNEESKGGYPLGQGLETFRKLKTKAGLRIRGFMAMLPFTEDESVLVPLADAMRELYDNARAESGDICFLSMGMSNDWRLCLKHGANMIRIGTGIFGERTYPAKPI